MTDRFDLMSPRRKGDKTYWTRVGSMFPAKTGDGWAIKLDALPLPDEKGEVWVRAFPPKERDQDPHEVERRVSRSVRDNFPQERARPSALAEKLNDDIPF